MHFIDRGSMACGDGAVFIIKAAGMGSHTYIDSIGSMSWCISNEHKRLNGNEKHLIHIIDPVSCLASTGPISVGMALFRTVLHTIPTYIIYILGNAL